MFVEHLMVIITITNGRSEAVDNAVFTVNIQLMEQLLLYNYITSSMVQNLPPQQDDTLP